MQIINSVPGRIAGIIFLLFLLELFLFMSLDYTTQTVMKDAT